MHTRQFIGSVLVAFAGLMISSSAWCAGGVSGKVSVTGQVSKPKPINMSSEPDCAKQYTTPPTAEDVVAGQSGALKNVVVYISAGGSEETAPSQPASLTQKACRFAPHITVMQAGQEIQIVNSDSTSHNVHPLPTSNREWNKAQPPGTPAISEKFARDEFIPVRCNIHPWMRGYIAVLKTSHYSVTGDDGAFSLGNLPPGKYTITAWHETLGKQTQEVTITGNENMPINFTFTGK